MSIDYPRFARYLNRCIELAAQNGIKEIVTITYNGILKPLVEPYLALDKAVTKAEETFTADNTASGLALRAFDSEFATARAAAIGFLPNLVIPESLKAQPTDTDKANAVEKLLDTLTEHKNELWAKTLLEGAFGTQAAIVLKDLHDETESNKALSRARTDRAKAYGPTHEKYMSFKHVVRAACGPHSKEYHRIHMRGTAAEDVVVDPNAQVPAPAPSPQQAAQPQPGK
jgi:hypothetical protein